MATNLSKILIAYRQKHDVTQKGLADAMGVTVSRISGIERGGVPDLETAMHMLQWMVFDSEAIDEQLLSTAAPSQENENV